MSRLTWQAIDAPRLDIQGLAQTAAGITNSFDKFGQALINKEESLRTEATDAAIAEAMSLQDPEAVKARLMQGAGGLGKRVNTRDFMEAMGAHQNQLMDTTLKHEDVLNARAYAELGDEGASLLNAATKGDRAAMDQVLALAAENPLWARVAQPFMKDASGAYDSADNRRMTGDRDAEAAKDNLRQHARGMAAVAAQREGNSVARDRFNWERQQDAQGKQDSAFVGRYTDNLIRGMPKSLTQDEMITTVTNSKGFQRQPAHIQEAVLGRLSNDQVGWNARLKPTEAQLMDDPTTARTMGLIDNLGSRAKTIESARLSRFDAENPEATTIRAAETKYKDATVEEVQAAYKSRGISSESLEAIRQQTGLGYPQLMAMVKENGNVADAPFWSMRNVIGRPGDSLWDRYTSTELFTGGERAASEMGEKIKTLRNDAGELAKYDTGRTARAAETKAAESKLARLSTVIRQKRAAGESVDAEYIQARVLQDQIDRMDQTLGRKVESKAKGGTGGW